MTECEVPIDTDTCRAVSAIVERNGKYLLVLRANEPAKGMYAFPGGRIEPGESARDAAIRELAEETGIAATSARPYATYDLTAGRAESEPHYLLTVFLVEEDGTAKAKALDDAAAIGWFAIKETTKLLMPPSMHLCFEKISRSK